MDALKRPLGLLLGLMAVAVFLHFVFTPFYEDLVDTLSIWQVLNWFMAVGILLTLVVTCACRKGTGSDGRNAND